MQILVLLLGRLTPPRGAAGHVIDEFVMPGIQAMLFALAEQRHVLPARFAVDAVKIACSVMLTLCRPHTGGKTLAVESRRLRSEEHTSALQSLRHIVCRLLLDK